MMKFGSADHENAEDTQQNKPQGLTLNLLVSYLPKQLKQVFLDFIALNVDIKKFDYPLLFDAFNFSNTGTLDVQACHDALKMAQESAMSFYDMDVREYDFETHTVSVQRDAHVTSEYLADTLDYGTYRTVSINQDYNPPIPYMGNKEWLTDYIARGKIVIPPHKIWIEPFCGSATMTLAQHPSTVEIISDYDSYLVNFLDVLSRPALRSILLDQLTHYFKAPRRARELHLPYLSKLTVRAKKVRGEGEKRVTKKLSIGQPDSITLARAFYICSKFDFGMRSLGYLDRFAYDDDSDKSVTQHTIDKRIESLTQAGERLERVIIQQGDGLQLIREYAGEKDVFFYIDPPYVMSTRVTGAADYSNELTDEEHNDLVDLLLSIRGSAILSGYSSQAYIRLEREGWKTLSVEIERMGRLREEMVWIKPTT
ncbi:DNA adenine methylase [Acidithiobacillus ferrivorans]|nr:DNA adenine methylase [Acidithiobacillus ferrivorans]